MTIYTDKIVVSFSHNYKSDVNNCFEIRCCKICKTYKELKHFISLQKDREYNIICRKCLDKQNIYRKNAKLKKSKDASAEASRGFRDF